MHTFIHVFSVIDFETTNILLLATRIHAYMEIPFLYFFFP